MGGTPYLAILGVLPILKFFINVFRFQVLEKLDLRYNNAKLQGGPRFYLYFL